MGEKKGEDLYCNFSRKDIQGLCKKYGLPANKSNFEMATSLILYLEKKNLNSRTMWDSARSDPCPSGTSELRVGAGMTSICDQRKDCRGAASHSGSGNKQHSSQDVQQNDSQNCRDIVTSDKASENAGILTHLYRDSVNGTGLPENALSSVVSSPLAARSSDFQFDVRSEDGIQLCVDLNSTPSDWIESMKSGVHVCQCHDLSRCSSQGLQKDLGLLCSKQKKSSSCVDSDKDMNNGNSEDGSSPTTTGTGVQAQFGELDVVEGSLYTAGLKSCINTIHAQEYTGERQAGLPSVESDREKQISSVKYCEGEGTTVSVGLAVNAVTQVRASNFSGNSCDLNHSWMLGKQVLHVGDDIYVNSSTKQNNGLLNSSSEYIVSPASGSVVMKPTASTTSVQDVTPPRADTSMDRGGQLRHTEREHFRLPQSIQFLGNPHELQSFERADTSQYVTCSKSGSMEDVHQTASVSGKQDTGAEIHLATCHRENMSLSPSKRYGFLGITNGVATENGGVHRQYELSHEAVDVHSSMAVIQREGTLPFPCSNGVSLDLVVPQRSGMGSCILTCTNELDHENRKSHPVPLVGDLGTSDARDGKESSECLDRDFCMGPPNPESNGEVKRKREINSVKDQSNCFTSDSRISKFTKQSSGNVHASRRRSSRLFTKVAGFVGEITQVHGRITVP